MHLNTLIAKYGEYYRKRKELEQIQELARKVKEYEKQRENILIINGKYIQRTSP